MHNNITPLYAIDMITTLTYEILDGMSKLVQTKVYRDGSVTKCTINPVTGLPQDVLEEEPEEVSREQMIANIIDKF